MRLGIALSFFMLAGCAAPVAAEPYHLVPGSYVPNRGPDGNSIFLEAPHGLILVDTGRHPEHSAKLLAHARERGRPIAAIINTHWHYDHTTGNVDIRPLYPQAEVVASDAIDGPFYKDFIAESRRNTEQFIASGEASEAQKAEVRRAFAVMDNTAPLKAERAVDRSGTRLIAGRPLDIRLSRYAVTEGDVWIYDPAEKLAIVGDLVVAPVPFMDTACAEGWKSALGEIAASPWETLIPGHGEPMNRAQFDLWRGAFNALIDCGRSTRPVAECADDWVKDARPFIPAGDEQRMKGMVDYYVKSRLRSSPEEQQRYCRPLTAAATAPERG